MKAKAPPPPPPPPQALVDAQTQNQILANQKLQQEMELAKQQQAQQAAQRAAEEQARQQAAAQAAAAAAAARSAFESKRSSAYNDAQTRARSTVTGRGLNYDEFANDIGAELSRQYNSIPDLSADPYSSFDPNTADNVLNRITGERRTKYTNDVNNAFAPDYAVQQFADTADDDIINRILEEQYNPAYQQLDRGKARGILTDEGYQSAVSTLANQKTAGNAKLQQVGGNVLNTYRGQTNDTIGGVRKQASDYQLGQNFDLNSGRNLVNSKVSSLRGSLEGDIRKDLGGENLFDVSSAFQTGGSAQGAQNTGRTELLDVLAQQNQRKQQQRGLGTQGSF